MEVKHNKLPFGILHAQMRTRSMFHASNKSDQLQLRHEAAIILQFLSCLGDVTSWNICLYEYKVNEYRYKLRMIPQEYHFMHFINLLSVFHHWKNKLSAVNTNLPLRKLFSGAENLSRVLAVRKVSSKVFL